MDLYEKGDLGTCKILLISEIFSSEDGSFSFAFGDFSANSTVGSSRVL